LGSVGCRHVSSCSTPSARYPSPLGSWFTCELSHPSREIRCKTYVRLSSLMNSSWNDSQPLHQRHLLRKRVSILPFSSTSVPGMMNTSFLPYANRDSDRKATTTAGTSLRGRNLTRSRPGLFLDSFRSNASPHFDWWSALYLIPDRAQDHNQRVFLPFFSAVSLFSSTYSVMGISSHPI